MEDNHRVELRVYQQKVKHLEYEHRNNLKTIIEGGTSLLEVEQSTHEDRERDLLRLKEELKLEQMEVELANANKVADIRTQHDKQLIKLRQQFDDGLSELISRCEERVKLLESDLELRRRVEVHEVEERKNQHINDLVINHKKAFAQMKDYYNGITLQNLKLIKDYQIQVEKLKEGAITHKKALQECILENQKLSEPLKEVSDEIKDLETLLKERPKDQMALLNASSRFAAIGKSSTTMRQKLQQLESEYAVVERERDRLYSGFEESIQRVRHQSEFHNQVLEQRLIAAESNVEKAAVQVEEIIRAANLDSNEVARMMTSLHQMLAAKDDVLKDSKFMLAKLQKSFNDSLETFVAKMKELGIPEDEVASMGFQLEVLPIGTSSAPAIGLVAKLRT